MEAAKKGPVAVEEHQPKSFEEEVWRKLSRINCNDHVEKKRTGGSRELSYLSWAWAWGTLMEHYPQSHFAFGDTEIFPDETQMVWTHVTVKDGDREMKRSCWLPVLDHANKPVRNPNAFQINTTRMRCLTKCLAWFGLGHYIYAGEDIPGKDMDPEAVDQDEPIWHPEPLAHPSAPKLDEKLRREYLAGIQAAIYNEDRSGLQELLRELAPDHEMKLGVWNGLNSRERRFIKDFEKEGP